MAANNIPSLEKSGRCRDGHRIFTATPDDFRRLTSLLEAHSFQYFSSQLHSEQTIKAVIRGLHRSIPLKEVSVEISDRGFTVKSITRLGTSDHPSDLIYVQLARNESAAAFFKLRSLYGLAVRIERKQKSSSPTQCYRCQRPGHGQSRCHALPVCLKCGFDHLTHECTKPSDTPAYCGNCGGSHPANYAGCVAFKDVGGKRKATPARSQSGFVREGVSYGAAVSSPFSKVESTFNAIFSSMSDLNPDMPSDKIRTAAWAATSTALGLFNASTA